MFTISKDFAFSASHCLDGLSPGHPCSRVHGHNYTARITLATDLLDDAGMVLDYACLAPVRDMIDRDLDHRHLNDVVDFNPTAEQLAAWLTTQTIGLLGLAQTLRPVSVTVAVSETPKTWAQYGPVRADRVVAT